MAIIIHSTNMIFLSLFFGTNSSRSPWASSMGLIEPGSDFFGSFVVSSGASRGPGIGKEGLGKTVGYPPLQSSKISADCHILDE